MTSGGRYISAFFVIVLVSLLVACGASTPTPLSVVTVSSLATAVVNSPYSATLQANSGTPPYTWSITSGSLPPGLTLNASTGVISGTPTAPTQPASSKRKAAATTPTTYSFTVTVTDSSSPAKTASASMQIVLNPQLALTTASLPAGVVGTAYNQTLAATGGMTPYAWTVTTGSLPAGLSLNASTGAITGTPIGPQVGTISFTVTVTDSESPTKTATVNLSISISAPTLTITTSSLTGGTLGTAYSEGLTATGGVAPYTWAVTTGSLPAGLALNGSTGQITGTPTGHVTGPINFGVTVTDSETPTTQASEANLSITITSPPLSVTTSSLATGVVQSAYSATLQATGGVSSYTWSVTTGTLPAGLSLNAATGAITGTPTTAGTSPITVTVADSETPTAKTATANLSIVVNQKLAVTTSSLGAAVVGTTYNQTLAATGGITPYTWAVTTGSLPAGLSLNASTGAITGTPTGPQVGTINFTVTATDSESPTKTATANLSIIVSAPPLSVTTSSLAGGTLGTAYSATLGATGGITPYTWSISVGALPAGLTLNASTGQITGTPTGSMTGPITFTAKVTDSEQPTAASATAALSITITAAPLSVVTSSLPNGVAQSAYAGATLQAAGGVSPYTWSVTTGSLPAGLLLNSATGAISGTPTASGPITFTVTVTDSEIPTPQTANRQLTITINPQLTVTTSSLAAAVVGTAYNQTLAATGGITPYTWTVTIGSLPAGLTLNASTGAITGTPTGPQVGAINFTVTATDSESPTKTANANLSITVSAPPLSVTTSSLAGGTLGTAYSATLGAMGGITPYTWSVSVGSLPAGLSLNTSTGAITGTPTGNMTGPINFTVKVTDSEQPAGSATAALSITITAPPLSVTTSSFAVGVVASAYSASLQATGGVSPYSWSVTTGTLPAGLSLNSSTGAITGSPTTAGTSNFTVTATDSETPTPQTATKNLSITVNPQLTVTTSSLAPAAVGTAYNQALAATGGITPYTWSVTTGSLPAGLTLNASTGAITGTPTGPQVGAINFTVTATDSESPTKTATANLSITVSAPPLSVTTSSLAGGTLGTAYSATVAATGGITPYTWSVSVGSIPAGLSLNSSTGAITGTPTGSVTGPINFTIKVTDAEQPAGSATAALSIAIAAAPLSVVTSSLPTGVAQSVYAGATLQGAGGVSPYTWSVTTGSLPAGLSLNGSTGAISGTPTTAGITTFTVTITDSETPTPQTATKQLSITVNPKLAVTTSSLTGGIVGAAYNQTLAGTGGLTPYTWSISSGSLPGGLSLNSSTGAITGTPTTAGTFNFTAKVTDSETPTQSATANLSITINAQLVIQTSGSLPQGVINITYPGATLQATGGVTPYTWSISTGNLPPGMNLNTSTGAITGTATSTGTFGFTAKVTDSGTPQQTATANLSVVINGALAISTTSPMPSGVLTQFYSQNLAATGGITPYTWSQTGGSLPTGLTLSSNGLISGTPSATGTFNFTVKVTDSETPTQSVTKSLSITINNSAPLQIITSALTTGVINTGYGDQFAATGGIQPYTWSITAGSLPPGITLTPSTGALTGAPTSMGTFNFTAKVTDSSSPTQSVTANLSITVNAALTITTTSLPSGSVSAQYPGTVSAAGGIEPYTWSIISGNLPPGLTANNSNDMLSFSGQPTTAGTYNFTVQVSDSEPSPASLNGNFTIVINNTPVGYTVSGTVSYGGTKTGRVYLALNSNNCNGCNNNLGTSISAPGAFTIHGVLPGTYNLQVFMDTLGYGSQNAANPTGSSSNITVVNANVSGAGVTLIDPGTVTISSAPTWSGNQGSGAFSGGAFVSFQSIQNNNGIEMPASYKVGWSTSSSCSSFAGTKSFPATGQNNPWIVTGLTNGQTYYFCAQGVAGSSTGPWSAPSPGVLIEASPASGNYLVSGKVTFTTPATGPLYVGFYDQNSGNVYADVVGSKSSPPTSPAAYQVYVPAGSNYYFFGVIDQANSGLLNAPGQISNTNGNNAASVAISGTTPNENLNLPTVNSTATVSTQAQEQISPGNPTTTNYSIGFQVNGSFKLPVAVEITAESDPGAVIPADIATGTFNGSHGNQFSYWTNLNGATPKVGDSYTLNVTYSDGSTGVFTPQVTAVLNNAFVTPIEPQGSSVSVQPNFSWTDPANASNYTYQFWLCCNQNGTIWQIPGNNSNSNGFSSSYTSIPWGTDPTGSGSLPNVSSLNGSSYYSWQIQASDANGNSAQVQVNFQTAAAPLTLPAAGSVGSVTVSQSFNGAINASGGTGPNYYFTVNGSPVPTNGQQVSLGDNLFAWNTGGNTLSLGGTPTSPMTVSFTVAVTDSASVTAGPYTYTITVNTPTPLSLQTTAMPGGDKSWAYNAKLQANGGVQPYTWSVIGGNLPAGLSISTDSGSNGIISGTPTATGTANFTVQVTDSSSVSATGALSITIGNCGNNANLNGHYAFTLNGWKSATDFQTTIGSFVANGTGSIGSGLLDINDQNKGPISATATGTYCVSSNNLVAISLTASGGASGTAVFEAALDTTGNGHIIRYDATSTEISSGLLRKQTTSAFSTGSIKNNFAFGMIGVDPGSDNRFGMAGQFNSNGTGTLSGEVDGDQSSNGPANTTLSASDFSVASSGRGTVDMDLVGPGISLNLVFYVVSAGELLVMEDDSGNLLMTGQALQQSASLTNASLKGNSVIELEGLDTSGGTPVSDIQAGIINASGSGTFTATLDENDGGSFDGGAGSPQSISGDYSVATNGRVTLSNVTGGGGGNNHLPVFYLVGLNQAFVIDTGSEVSFGTITPQTGSSFTNASLSGTFMGGSQQPVDTNASAEVDQVHADGAGNLTGASDNNSNGCASGNACPQSSSLSSITYSVASNGRTTVSQAGQVGVILYIISGSQAVILPTTDSNPALDDFHQ